MSEKNRLFENFTKIGEVLRCIQTEIICVSCIECAEKFDTIDDLHQHYDIEHNSVSDVDLYNTIVMKQSNSDVDEYDLIVDQSDEEFQTNEDDVKLEIATIGPNIGSTNDIRMQSNNEIANIQLRCNCCSDESYPCIGMLKDHLFITQNLEAYPCDQCGGLYFNKAELTSHEMVHESAIEPEECKYCKTLFANANELHHHLNSSGEEETEEDSVEEYKDESKKRLKCSVCNKSYVRSTAYIDHILEHEPNNRNNKKSFNCDICCMTYNSISKFQAHFHTNHKDIAATRLRNSKRNISTQDKDVTENESSKFQCSVCDKSFRSKENFIQHQRIHTNERPYSCKICHKRFNHSSYINIHMRTHTKQKPYRCAVCGKQFISQSKLTTHEKNHQNIRPHVCDQCNKSFRTPADLRDHIRSEHTNERPYDCSVCGRSFAKYKLLMQHKYLHAETKRFKCRFCSMAFSQSAGRHGHEKRMHSTV